MDDESVKIAIEALKEEGIDLMITLPEEPNYTLIEAIRSDSHFTSITATNEAHGISMCAGASLAGRTAVFITGVAGLQVATFSLSQLGSNYGAPFLVLASYRGDWGDFTPIPGSQLFLFKKQAEPLMNALGIPYRVVDRKDMLGRAIREAHFAARSYGTPVVLFFSGELWRS